MCYRVGIEGRPTGNGGRPVGPLFSWEVPGVYLRFRGNAGVSSGNPGHGTTRASFPTIYSDVYRLNRGAHGTTRASFPTIYSDVYRLNRGAHGTTGASLPTVYSVVYRLNRGTRGTTRASFPTVYSDVYRLNRGTRGTTGASFPTVYSIVYRLNRRERCPHRSVPLERTNTWGLSSHPIYAKKNRDRVFSPPGPVSFILFLNKHLVIHLTIGAAVDNANPHMGVNGV